MSVFTINRPSITIIEHKDGKRFSYSVTASTWRNEYIRTRTFESAKDAKKAANAFNKAFDIDAKTIEQNGRQFNIMAAQIDQQRFVTRKKLTAQLAAVEY